jgi:aldose 1-epimerase
MRIYEIKNEYQTIRLLDLGATIIEWLAFSDKISIVMNNDDLNVYKDSSAGYFGATVGRVANRIKNATFELNNQTYYLAKNNHKINHLHGGIQGFNLKKYEVIEHSDTKIIFKTVSPDMEEGYPGTLTLYVTYELHGKRMQITYDATTTKDTIVNITNHSHFNLGDKDILNHELLMHSDRYLETDELLIPTGVIKSVQDTSLDFRVSKVLGPSIMELSKSPALGIDHAFLFEQKKPQIKLSFKNRELLIETSYPGTQIYTMNHPRKQLKKGGTPVKLYEAIAFECQFEPDAIHHNNFSNTVLKPNEVYHQYISYTLNER